MYSRPHPTGRNRYVRLAEGECDDDLELGMSMVLEEPALNRQLHTIGKVYMNRQLYIIGHVYIDRQFHTIIKVYMDRQFHTIDRVHI